MTKKTYSQLMMESPAHITLRLDTKEPIELGDFVGAFTSLASEFDRFIREKNPRLKDSSQIYVREVRAGSIEADLLPAFAMLMINDMDKILILEDFIRRWGSRFLAFLNRIAPELPATKSELKDWMDGVVAIANDPNVSSEISVATFTDGIKEVKSSFKFNSSHARIARDSIEERLLALDSKTQPEHKRVLMIFTRLDYRNAKIGKKSGELVVIQSVSDKPLSLIYGSDLAEAHIKHVLNEAEENICKKGFIVDAVTTMHGEKPAGYTVTNLHQVIDLPD